MTRNVLLDIGVLTARKDAHVVSESVTIKLETVTVQKGNMARLAVKIAPRGVLERTVLNAVNAPMRNRAEVLTDDVYVWTDIRAPIVLRNATQGSGVHSVETIVDV